MKKFFEETNNSNTLSDCFNGVERIEVKAGIFEKTLKSKFRNCFPKIRLRSTKTESDIDRKMKLRQELKTFIKNNKCQIGKII